MTRIICNILDTTGLAGSDMTLSDASLNSLSRQLNSTPPDGVLLENRNPIFTQNYDTLKLGHALSAEVVDGALRVLAEVRDDVAAAIAAGVMTISPCVTFKTKDVVEGEIQQCTLEWLSVCPVHGREVEVSDVLV